MLLDVDGTLLDVEDDPRHVVADAELSSLLLGLRRANAIALVSGRSIVELDRVFAPHHFAASGAHGSELRHADGTVERLDSRPLPTGVIERLTSFVTDRRGLLLEKKPAGVALHYRVAPEFEEACRNLMRDLVLQIPGHRLLMGKMVCELTPAAHDKGTAVCRLLKHPRWRGRRPVFVGDDETDEVAFREVNKLGGVSVRVGVRERSEAAFRLPSVAAVRAWLAATVTLVA